jgi:hypothetical protein
LRIGRGCRRNQPGLTLRPAATGLIQSTNAQIAAIEVAADRLDNGGIGLFMRGGMGGKMPSQWATTLSPLAIVALVILIGASIYLWRLGYVRSRAAWITLIVIAGVLVYAGFFALQPPT